MLITWKGSNWDCVIMDDKVGRREGRVSAFMCLLMVVVFLHDFFSAMTFGTQPCSVFSGSCFFSVYFSPSLKNIFKLKPIASQAETEMIFNSSLTCLNKTSLYQLHRSSKMSYVTRILIFLTLAPDQILAFVSYCSESEKFRLKLKSDCGSLTSELTPFGL